MKRLLVIAGLLAVMMVTLSAQAAKKQAPPPAPPPLTGAAAQLESTYAGMLKDLEAEITKALPKVDAQEQAAFQKAYETEAAAQAADIKTLRSAGHGKSEEDKAAGAKAHEEAKAAREAATAGAQAPAKAVLADLHDFLASDKLDAKLTKCLVLKQGTPRGLAEFAAQGKAQEALVNALLANDALMEQMLVAGGAKDGQYGPAMQIYTDIQKASAKAKEGNLQRLALAVALEHAVPIPQSNPESQTDAPATVDPVQRYLHYEKAFVDGELDPAFKDLTAWDYRWVVNGDEPDEMLTWGRTMLRNYRPDEITTSDYRWRYVQSVKTEVKYGSQDVKYDRPELQKYQNMILNGGVCGRRAFFGRYILRSFGIPVVRRPQPGHAALAHWTPNGWVVCLGAGWEWGTTDFGESVDFEMHTQARSNEAAFMEALRAQWIGAILGEPPAFGLHDTASGFWSGVALYRQREIVEEKQAVALAAVGSDIAEANESKEAQVVEDVHISDADRAVTVDRDGAITIPAVACSKPTQSTKKILFMQSNLGGLQMHYARLGEPEAFSYTFDAPAGGTYALSARVVTTSDKQHLLVAANDAEEPTDIAVPFTVGMWETTPPVNVQLVKGRNVLNFSRTDPVKGLTIKDFTLTPVM